MTQPTVLPNLYRPAAGAVIFNDKGQVWLGRRRTEKRDDIWQYPQGGIDEGELAHIAAKREVEEETGIPISMLTELKRLSTPLFYDLPLKYKTTPRTKKWQGQKQYWFAYQFGGVASDINLNNQSPPEFSSWRWGNLHEAVDTVIDFKRDIYARLAEEFEAFASP